jgi:hypothetical protein
MRLLQTNVLVLAFLVWALPASAGAQTAAVPVQAAASLPEMGGVVTSQPLTLYGQWFHAGFTQNWNAHADIDKYQLLVKERLLPRGGTEVQIFSGDNVVYRAVLPRSAAQILALSEAAVDLAYQNALEQSLQALLFRDADLSKPGL